MLRRVALDDAPFELHRLCTLSIEVEPRWPMNVWTISPLARKIENMKRGDRLLHHGAGGLSQAPVRTRRR